MRSAYAKRTLSIGCPLILEDTPSSGLALRIEEYYPPIFGFHLGPTLSLTLRIGFFPAFLSLSIEGIPEILLISEFTGTVGK